MRITLVIPTLGSGGAERVMSLMANYWTEHGNVVTLITLSAVEGDFYPLHSSVQRIGLALTGMSKTIQEAVLQNVLRILRLRAAIRQSDPDVVISFIEKTNILVLLSTIGLQIPVVACERTDPRYHRIEPTWSWLRWCMYRRATSLVVQTEGLRSWAEAFVDRNSVHVIPNPVSPLFQAGSKTGDDSMPRKVVAALGRLEPVKGFDNLIRAFAQCTRKYNDWSLVIIGEGSDREFLESLCVQLGITEHVSMIGRISNPAFVLYQAELFVLSSRYEGFPMALIEAMACQLPVVSTDCPSGPREIIRDGIDGVLVPPEDVSALAEAMSRLMESPQERQRLSLGAAKVMERFGIDTVMRLWSGLLTNIAGVSHV